MRSARVVGLTADGTFLVVVTDDGEELTILADERLRAALRGDRPRLGQLEIEMETSLSPRDIQTRIRAGASVDELARVANMPPDRVERFAAPVLAEREHIAAQAMSGTVRRRGETSAHRSLRIAVTERLVGRGIDVDSVEWDSYRMEDGRWAVTADYRSGEASRHAEFHYDLQNRFSVAANDEARWLLSEHSSTTGPQPGRRRPEFGGVGDGTEPTLDLNDELAIVRATLQPVAEEEFADQDHEGQDLVDDDDAPTASVTALTVVAETHVVEVVTVIQPAEDADTGGVLDGVEDLDGDRDFDGDEDLDGLAEPVDEASEPTVAVPRTLRPVVETHVEDREPLEAEPVSDAPLGTRYGTLGGDGYAEDSINVYAGLTEASAVPDAPTVSGWEPAIVVNYPVEPSQVDETEPPSDGVHTDHNTTAGASDLPGTDEPGRIEPPVDYAARMDEAEELEAEHDALIPAPEPVKKPTPRRKRASVPSWDEIMFGGPKKP